MKCLIEECNYEGKHDDDIAEHANLKHGAHFRRGRDGVEYVYLVAPRGQSIQLTHYVGDACPGGHYDWPPEESLGDDHCDLENPEVCEACQ